MFAQILSKVRARNVVAWSRGRARRLKICHTLFMTKLTLKTSVSAARLLSGQFIHKVRRLMTVIIAWARS